MGLVAIWGLVEILGGAFFKMAFTCRNGAHTLTNTHSQTRTHTNTQTPGNKRMYLLTDMDVGQGTMKIYRVVEKCPRVRSNLK